MQDSTVFMHQTLIKFHLKGFAFNFHKVKKMEIILNMEAIKISGRELGDSKTLETSSYKFHEEFIMMNHRTC